MKGITSCTKILVGMLISSGLHASLLFVADLNGAQDGVATTATGLGTVLLNDTENQITVDLSWNGLIGGPATAAHIHCCALPGVNAGVLFPFVIPNVVSGTMAEQTFAITPIEVAELEAGLMYMNVHDAEFPGGEIRGQLELAVPEAASFGLTAAALAVVAGLGLLRRRRRTIP